MKVNLNIEEDPQFRKYVRDLIGGEVRKILREQLSDIVAGEIAKLRLLQPDSPALTLLVEKQVNTAIQNQVRLAGKQIQDLTKAAVAEAVTPHISNMKMNIKEHLIGAIQRGI